MRPAPQHLSQPIASVRLRPALALSLLLLSPAASAASPRLTFLPSGPLVESLSPGAVVSSLSVARFPLGDSQRVWAGADRATAGAGETRLALPWEGEVPPRSVFAAVDGTTGEVVIATPGASLGVPLERPPELSLAVGAENIAIPGGWLAVLVVRPGGGAWTARLADGTADDADGERNDVVTVAGSALQPVEASGAAFTSFAAGDVLVAIELDTFRAYTARVGGAP